MSGCEPPLYTHDDTVKFMDNVVLLPMTHPAMFNAITNPARRCLALFGRKGVQKLRLVENILIARSVPYCVVNVEPAQTTRAMKEIRLVHERLAGGGTGVLVIDHADILCFEPDTEAVMETCLQLSQLAKDCGMAILILCDRTPPTPEDDTQVPRHLRMYYERFFGQFNGSGYMPTPPSAYRIDMFRWYFTRFEQTVGTHNGVTFKLSDGDYIELADASSYCTIDAVVVWIRRVLYKFAVPRDQPFVIEIKHLVTFFNTNQGFPHISRLDMEAIENKWSVANGNGQLHSLRSCKRKTAFKAPVEWAKKGRAGPTNVTGFTEETVDPKKATEALNKKKRRTPVHKKAKGAE